MDNRAPAGIQALTVDDAIPPQPCAECGRWTDVRHPETLHETTGWVKRRPRSHAHRSSGGVHALKFRYETGRVMCGRCARTRKDTGTAAQESML